MLEQLFAILADYPEPVTVMMYGDHMPGIGAKASQLTTESLLKTPYVIWSNDGRTDAAPSRKDMSAFEMSPYLLELLGIRAGVMFRYRQSGTVAKQDELTLTYDIFRGEQYCYADDPPTETVLTFGYRPVTLSELRQEGEALILYGEGFNAFSRVYRNGHALDTLYISEHQLVVQEVADAEDVFTVCQVKRDGIEVIATSNEKKLE